MIKKIGRERDWISNEALCQRHLTEPNNNNHTTKKSEAKMNKILHITIDRLSDPLSYEWLVWCTVRSSFFSSFFVVAVFLCVCAFFAFAVAEILGHFAFLINFVPIFWIDVHKIAHTLSVAKRKAIHHWPIATDTFWKSKYTPWIYFDIKDTQYTRCAIHRHQTNHWWRKERQSIVIWIVCSNKDVDHGQNENEKLFKWN